jgi:hypothetical protein
MQATQFGIENCFAAGIQFGSENCRLPNSAARTGSLQAAQFGSENCFAVGATISAANANS